MWKNVNRVSIFLRFWYEWNRAMCLFSRAFFDTFCSFFRVDMTLEIAAGVK